MSTLRVIVDDVVASGSGRAGHYAEEITRELIRTAPRGSSVSGIVAASPESDYRELERRLPGLRSLYKTALARRELQAAWQHGFTRLPGSGMIHATSLLAPLRRHDRGNNQSEQTVVTMHDAIAWTRPELLPSRVVSWHRRMGKRAERYADAVVVPTHAVAAELGEHLSLEGRIRVIGGAASSELRPPRDAAHRRRVHGMPSEYVLTIAGSLAPSELEILVRAMAHSKTGSVPLIIVGAGSAVEPELRDIARDAGFDPERVRSCDELSPLDESAILGGATIVVQPNHEDGFGLAMLDAFSFGRPVIHLDAPSLVELSADASLVVARDDSEQLADRLGDAIAELLSDDSRRESLGVAAADRTNAFSWRDSAEKIWQLHADL